MPVDNLHAAAVVDGQHMHARADEEIRRTAEKHARPGRKRIRNLYTAHAYMHMSPGFKKSHKHLLALG